MDSTSVSQTTVIVFICPCRKFEPEASGPLCSSDSTGRSTTLTISMENIISAMRSAWDCGPRVGLPSLSFLCMPHSVKRYARHYTPSLCVYWSAAPPRLGQHLLEPCVLGLKLAQPLHLHRLELPEALAPGADRDVAHPVLLGHLRSDFPVTSLVLESII